MTRIAAHKIIFEGKEYHKSVAEADHEGVVRIFPLTHEIHSTVFISGCVKIEVTGGQLLAFPQ